MAHAPPTIFWFIPTSGDGRYLASPEGWRPPDVPYLREVAIAADRLGFEGALLPTGPNCFDAWTLASAFAGDTERLKFLIALRPGIVSPTLAARQSAALDRLTNGRLLLNIVTGGDPTQLAADGLHLDHDARYAQTAEFLRIWRAVMTDTPIHHEGAHFHVVSDKPLHFPPVQRPYPPIYLGGASPAAIEVAAEHVDHYLIWAEPVDAVAAHISKARAAASRFGRTLRFGIRLHLIVRETAAEAWAAADRLISKIDDAQIEAARIARATRTESEGQRRQTALHGYRRDALEVAPNFWVGAGLVRDGAGAALVGDAEAVAARIREYQDAGVETFIASGYPHLEEAYAVAELLFPRLGIDAARPRAPLRRDREFGSEPAAAASAS